MPAPYTPFLQVPSAYTPCPDAFEAVLKKAGRNIVKIAVIGDSQETQYGGSGGAYLPALNYEFALRYGNAPCSTIGNGNYGGYGTAGSDTGCKWLRTGRNPLSGGAAFMPSSRILPNLDVTAINTNANYQSGKLIALNDKMSAALHPQHRYVNFFDASQGVQLELFLGTRPDAAPITLGTAYNANWSHSFTLNDAIANINPGLVAPLSSIVKYRSPTLNGPSSSQYLYTGTRLTNAGTAAVDLIDGRFYTSNPNKQYGVVVDNFGFGGYTAQAWYDAFKGAGEMLNAVGPYDMVILHFGANDSIGTAAAHESALRLLIEFVRSSHQNQRLPVVICSDGYRQHASTPIRDVYQTFPGVGLSLAQELDNVMVVNLQRMTEQAGIVDAAENETLYTSRGAWSSASVAYSVNNWVTVNPLSWLPNSGTSWVCIEAHTSNGTDNGPGMDRYWRPLKRYLSDGVHLSLNGQALAAKMFVAALYQAAFLPDAIQPGLPEQRRRR